MLLPSTGPAASSRAYRPSHRCLLCDIDGQTVDADGPALGLGGIVIPASRALRPDSPSLSLAAELADATGAALVLICSREARPVDVPQWMSDRLGDRLMVVEFSEVRTGYLPELASMEHPLTTRCPSSEVGTKRNLGLVIGQVARWPSLLFLDDDISANHDGPTITASRLRRCLQVLHARKSMKAIGWTCVGTRDNSVVGHARHRLGLPQEIFIGGGTLLVRLDPQVPFFSGIYNEDWWFLQSLLLASERVGGCIGVAGTTRQAEYDPFRSTARARREEVGELVGEVMMNCIEDADGGQVQLPRTHQWAAASRARVAMIDDLITRAKSSGDLAVVQPLQAAADVQKALSAEEVRDYVQLLRADARNWSHFWQSLPRRAWRSDVHQLFATVRAPLLKQDPWMAVSQHPYTPARGLALAHRPG